MRSLELSQEQLMSEELGRAGPILDDFLKSLQTDQELDTTETLALSSLNLCPGIDHSSQDHRSFSELLQVYDQVADHWMASLPSKVSNLSRLSKYKIARRVAVELCLSSIGISLCNKTAQEEQPPAPEVGDIVLPILSKTYDLPREDSPLPSSRATQSLSQDAGFNVPLPAQTPSLYSHGSSTSQGPTEDPAILRLRQYVTSTKSPLSFRNSPLLSVWPAFPGTDPADFAWEGLQEDPAENDDEKNPTRRRRREEARRHRKAKKFLEQETTTARQALSQPISMSFGSQPGIHQHATSSQPGKELPMTQPDRGLFGSRAQLGVKRQKKRRAAGF
jgi:RNA polymerase I-specific transcription initiation factor RRN6